MHSPSILSANVEKTRTRLYLILKKLYHGTVGKNLSVRHMIPKMLSGEEKKFLSFFARHQYKGAGELVDLGCWLGGSTLSILEGLCLNRLKATHKKKVHAFDKFLWEPYMDLSVGDTEFKGRFVAGERFDSAFQKHVEKWQSRVETYQCDLGQFIWNSGPIEFLMVDAMKDWATSRNIVFTFYPALLSGATVLHQDFSHYFTYWIHLIQYRLRDYFSPVLDLKKGSSGFVFRVSKPIPKDFLGAELWDRPFLASEIGQAFDYSKNLVASSKHGQIIAARIRCLRDFGFCSEADSLMQTFSPLLHNDGKINYESLQ